MPIVSVIATSVMASPSHPRANNMRLRPWLKSWRGRMERNAAVLIACGMLGVAPAAAVAQDMMRHVDLTSPEMTSAEMTRDEVVARITAATSASLDFTGKKLSGLDLSGLDLSGAILRAARLNKTKLRDPKLDRGILVQVWRRGAARWRCAHPGPPRRRHEESVHGAHAGGTEVQQSRASNPARCGSVARGPRIRIPQECGSDQRLAAGRRAGGSDAHR